jgi:hypothetical protein
MRQWINRAAVLAALSCTSVLAKPVTPDEAIKREYPDAKTEVTGTKEINGVKVEDVKITNAKGQESIAKVTEFGDFLLMGESRGDQSISQPAMDTLAGLFNAGQKDVDCYRVTSYVVEVSSGKKDFRLTFDPVGRLHDIVNESEARQDASQALQKVDDKDKGLKADDYAKKYTDGAVVEAVYKSPVGDNFFLVDMKKTDGTDARITLNNDGRVFSFRDQIGEADVPPPVASALKEMFSNAKVSKTYRYEYEYYQMDKVSPDGDRMNIQIRPNGDILSVNNEGIKKEEAASPAAAASGAVKKKKN